MAKRIFALSETLTDLSDAELLKKGREIRWRAKSGVPLHALLKEAYALLRESARRAVKMQHFLVQIMGGIARIEKRVT